MITPRICITQTPTKLGLTGSIEMNQIVTINQSSVLTMSSLEIAKLVQSNHADVRRSIERLTWLHRSQIRQPRITPTIWWEETENDYPTYMDR